MGNKYLEIIEELNLGESNLKNFARCVSNATTKAGINLYNAATISLNRTLKEMKNNIWNTCRMELYGNQTKIPCDDENLTAGVRSVMFFLAIFILFVMTMVSKRNKACLWCCWKHPGPVVPVNLMDSYRNRHGYMLTFGVTVTACISVLFGSYGSIVGTYGAVTLEASPNYLKIFIRISLAIFISLVSYPIFAAQNMKNCLAGCILGLSYSALWLTLELYKHIEFSRTCWKEHRRINKSQLSTFQLLQDIPKTMSLFALTIRFSYVLFNIIRERIARKRNKVLKKRRMVSFVTNYSSWREDYMYIHVRNVFKKNLCQDQTEEITLEDTSIGEKIKKMIKSKVYEIKPGFLYSTRIMVSMFVSILAVYTVSMQICSLGYVFFHKYWREMFTTEIMRDVAKSVGISTKVVKKYVVWTGGCWWFALAAALSFYVLVFLNSMMWYRRHVLMLRRGDRSFLPSSIKKGTLDCGSLMNACLKYAGYQVGYTVWGFLITFSIIWLILTAFTGLLLIPAIYGTPSFLVSWIKGYWITVIIAVVTVIVQGQLVKRCFLISLDSVAVNNRRAFHITSYIMFYFNIFCGIISCLLRIAFGGILGVVFLPRLQKSTLPRSYERRDPGYLAYLGFLLVEHQHSNPVLQYFVRILLEGQKKELIQNDIPTYRRGGPSKYVKVLAANTAIDIDKTDIAMEEVLDTNILYARTQSHRARNRWHLFVILQQNPSLRKYRARYFERKISKSHLFNILNKNLKTQDEFEVKPEEKICVETVGILLKESRQQYELEQWNEEGDKPNKCSAKKMKRLKISRAEQVEENNTEKTPLFDEGYEDRKLHHGNVDDDGDVDKGEQTRDNPTVSLKSNLKDTVGLVSAPENNLTLHLQDDESSPSEDQQFNVWC